MALNNDIIDLLNDFGESFVTDLRDNLLSKEKSNTKSRLSSSIKQINTVFKDGTFTLKIELNDYYTFVDKGRGKGGVSKEGQKKIGEWGASRGYIGKFQTERIVKGQRQVRKKKLTFEKAKKQFIYLVSRKIKNKGYKGNDFYSEISEDGRFELLTKQLSELLSKNIVVEITK